MKALSILAALTLAVSIPAIGATDIIAQAGNKAGGNIILTKTKCPAKDIHLGSSLKFYTTDSAGKTRQTGCYGVIPSVLGPMVFITFDDTLRVFPAKAFHSPDDTTPPLPSPKINKQDWL